MTRKFANKRLGMTLVEVIIAAVVGGFIFIFLGYLTIFSSRNAINVRDQVVAQTAAVSASQAMAYLVTKRAMDFQSYSGDTLTSLTRVKFSVPNPANPATSITRTICWDPEKLWLEYYDSSANVTFTNKTVNGKSYPIPSGTPTQVFKHISDFIMTMESHEKLDLTLYFQYKGYVRHNASINDYQYGQYHVVLVAKNHFVVQGDYNDYTSDTTSPLIL